MRIRWRRSPCDRRGGGELRSRDTLDLMTALDKDGRFHRDSWAGAILHPGKVSYREVSPVDSLHILIDGNHVSAHVDDVSPLVVRPDGTIRYAWGRVVAHNVAHVVADVARRLHGRHGEHRCHLHCEAVWVDDDGDVRTGTRAEVIAS